MKMKRLLAVLLSLCMTISLVPVGTVHAEDSEELVIEKLDKNEVDADLLKNSSVDLTVDELELDENESVKVIIVMEGDSIVENNAAAVLNLETEEQMDQMVQLQEYVVALIEEDVLDGEELEVNYNYTWLLNGIAAQVPYGAIDEIEALDQVERVLLQPVYSVCETADSVADTMTISDGVMIGRESAWAQGYTGEGMKIAVIDTGLDIDHQNFQALAEDKLTDTSADAETVGAVLSQLNASARYSGLTVEDVYYSSKVAFGFNYCDNNLDITHDNDSQGDHGTHVAGIAAANKVDGSEVVGVAPDSQLYVMKVFGALGGAYTEDILAALEDALILGADVVNMSLGTPGGFTSSVDEVNEIYNRVAETGTVLSVSAGNNYNAGFQNNWGTDANLTSNPDNGVLGEPGTYTSSFTVASVENWMIETVYIDADGYKIVYTSGSNSEAAHITTLTGEYGLVVVPGYGEAADYEGLDVTGKVALVQRGGINFSYKHMYAEAAGAVACLVYNNTDGDFGMDLTGSTATIPCVSITMASGQYLAAAVEENAELTVSFPSETGPVPSEYAYEMSDFSSWGAAPDLTLEPDITAPGGNIYSTINNGEYGLMSGTSMSAPNVAGMSAVVMQYVKEKFGEDTDYRMLVQNLLMSTADPLAYDESGLDYSPRSQGAGLANVYNAVTTQAYLTVDDGQNPKVSLGDDAEKNGNYSFTFDVHNFGDSAAYYDLATTVQTEDYIDYGIYFMSGTPLALSADTENTSENMVLTYDVDNNGVTDSHDAYYVYRAAIGEPEVEGWESEEFRYDLNGNDEVSTDDVQAYLDELVGKEADVDLDDTVLKVAAGETAQVSVNVALTDEDRTYFETYYSNGGYVEGYTKLTALHAGGVDLSLPYLGFYGDWNDAPVLDDGSYWDYFSADYDGTQVVGNQYVHALFTEFGGDDYGYYPGLNAYVDEAFDINHISLSPDDNGYFDTISDIYVSLLRNASSLTFRYSNQETGEVYYELAEENASKSIYYSAYGQIVPYVYTWTDGELYDFTDNDGNVLTNNTKLLLEVEAVGVGESEDQAETWTVPITIDLEAPELLSVTRTVDAETGEATLELTFRDNHSAAAIGLLTSDGTGVYALNGVEDTEPDADGYQNYTVSYNVTGLTGKTMVVLADYALNESYYGVNLGGEGTPYGNLVAFQYGIYTGTNSWVSFDADVAYDETQIFTSDVNFVCAEYVNGYVFAQTESGALYGFKYTDMLNNTMDLDSTYIAQLDNVYQDLAYSYAEGKLYGLYTYEDDDGYPTAEVYSINLKGEYYDPDMWMTVEAYQEDWVLYRGGLYGLTLAIDDAGTVYVLGLNYDWDTEALTETAHLWSVGMEYDRWSDSYALGSGLSDLGDTGLSMDYLQSMTWDHNAEKLYWARFDVDGLKVISELVEIDPAKIGEEGSCTTVGYLYGETCALFAPLTEESAAKDAHANIPEMDSAVIGTPILRDSAVTMNIGGTKTLVYDIDPWYSEVRTVVWSSSDEAVATVDQNGTVTAVGTGSATITAASAVDENLFDTCTVEVTALDLKLEGIVSVQGEGIGNVSEPKTYEFNMVDGIASLNNNLWITASEDMNYGLSLATCEMGRGSIWASEFGNTGMIYEIDAETGAVKDVLQPIDGDMLFGLTYSEQTDTFAGIMNMYLYVDMPLTHEAEEEMLGSFDEEARQFTWHKINMLEYLLAAGDSFVTGETGQGASSEIVFCGITTIPGSGEHQYMYNDFTGGWGAEITYTADQTLVLMDNVGRLWYIDQVNGLIQENDDWGNTTYCSADGMTFISTELYGVFTQEQTEGIYNAYVIREVAETPLTDMFREGTMPRITYHFSDIEYAGETADGTPMFTMSLYDYWNNGTTNELYLLVPGAGTGEYTWDSNGNRVEIKTPDRLYSLGNMGEGNIIASIHSAEVTGGVDADPEEIAINPMAVGIYTAER